jgi:hypothetical protein
MSDIWRFSPIILDPQLFTGYLTHVNMSKTDQDGRFLEPVRVEDTAASSMYQFPHQPIHWGSLRNGNQTTIHTWLVHFGYLFLFSPSGDANSFNRKGCSPRADHTPLEFGPISSSWTGRSIPQSSGRPWHTVIQIDAASAHLIKYEVIQNWYVHIDVTWSDTVLGLLVWISNFPRTFVKNWWREKPEMMMKKGLLFIPCETGWWFGTWILFTISYMGFHPSHWLSYFFRMVIAPPASSDLMGYW